MTCKSGSKCEIIVYVIGGHCILVGNDMKNSDGTGKPIIVTLKLNQQQLELIDRTVARGVAPNRQALIKLALREYAAAHNKKVVR
jgi:hypothetical protein